jgi:hypothetical protein
MSICSDLLPWEEQICGSSPQYLICNEPKSIAYVEHPHATLDVIFGRSCIRKYGEVAKRPFIGSQSCTNGSFQHPSTLEGINDSEDLSVNYVRKEENAREVAFKKWILSKQNSLRKFPSAYPKQVPRKALQTGQASEASPCITKERSNITSTRPHAKLLMPNNSSHRDKGTGQSFAIPLKGDKKALNQDSIATYCSSNRSSENSKKCSTAYSNWLKKKKEISLENNNKQEQRQQEEQIREKERKILNELSVQTWCKNKKSFSHKTSPRFYKSSENIPIPKLINRPNWDKLLTFSSMFREGDPGSSRASRIVCEHFESPCSPPKLFEEYAKYQELYPEFLRRYGTHVAHAGLDIGRVFIDSNQAQKMHFKFAEKWARLTKSRSHSASKNFNSKRSNIH